MLSIQLSFGSSLDSKFVGLKLFNNMLLCNIPKHFQMTYCCIKALACRDVFSHSNLAFSIIVVYSVVFTG